MCLAEASVRKEWRRQPEATNGVPNSNVAVAADQRVNPARPNRTLWMPMPVIMLALALPVPSIAAAAVKVMFSTLADRVKVPRRLPHR
jgi:hypothetical protein